MLLLGILALALGIGARVSTAPAPASAVSGETVPGVPSGTEGRPRWEVLWTKPAPRLQAMDLSLDGDTVVWSDREGSIRCLDARGRTRWRTQPFAHVNRVVATPSGAVVAYSRLNPAQPTIHILSQADGSSDRAAHVLEGAVWNVAASPNSAHVVVGTGQRYVYVLSLQNADRPTRWRTPGIPESLSIASGEPLALLGTWQEAGASAFALDGTVRWRHDEPDPTRVYTTHLSADGHTAVGVSARMPRESEARVQVWDANTGRPLWTRSLDGFRPKALTTERGQFVAVTYVKRLSYRNGNTSERKLALFDRQGRRLWEKGGLFFSPELVALAPNGARLTVTDGVNTLYTLDARGKIVSRLRLPVDPKTGAPPTIRESVATTSGAFLLIQRGDGQITLLKAT